jgi:hypothetical protein
MDTKRIYNNKIFFKINFPHALKFFRFKNKSSFCCIIAGNKKSNHCNELYSKREEVIKWFNINESDSLHLYGHNWDKYIFSNRYLNYISRILNIPKKCNVYKGPITSKSETLANYKFSICFENASNFPGYITEKIFDCFCSNVVPVYLGPPNIQNFIPKNCYIDFNDFNSIDDLFVYMKKLSQNDYEEYLKNINSLLTSNKLHQFSNEYFINTISKNISLL